MTTTTRNLAMGRNYWGPSPLPASARLVGTVRRDDGRAGAMILIESTGIYVQGNEGVITTLPTDTMDAR